MGQEIQSSLAGWFCLGFFFPSFGLHATQSCSHLKAWLGLKDPLPRWPTHKADKLVLETGRRLNLVPHPKDISIAQSEFPQCIVTTFPRVRDPRERRLCDQGSEVALCGFYSILLISWSSPICCDRGTHRGVNSGDEVHWGPSWSLDPTYLSRRCRLRESVL